MAYLNEEIDKLVENGIVKNIAVRVGMGDEVLYDAFRGEVNEETLFDMASVTKIMATTTLSLIALDKGLLMLDGEVNAFYPDKKHLTIRHLLTHTVGIGHKDLTRLNATNENIAEKILEIPSDIPIGTDVLYSCPGFILLGKILERVFENPLEKCFDELVAKPLGLSSTSFLPKNRQNAVNSNLDEELRGVVNDYNCRYLGGIAGNAGLFSNIRDVTKYVALLRKKGAPLFSEEAFLMASSNQTAEMSNSRGLGFLYVDGKYAQTGGLFDEGAIGHCGHTGQSVFVDYRTGQYVIILSDATVSTVRKYGCEHYDEVMKMRAQLHNAISKDMKK